MLEKTALKEQNEELKLTVEVGLQAFLPGLGNRSRVFLAPWSRSRLRKKPPLQKKNRAGAGAAKICRSCTGSQNIKSIVHLLLFFRKNYFTCFIFLAVLHQQFVGKKYLRAGDARSCMFLAPWSPSRLKKNEDPETIKRGIQEVQRGIQYINPRSKTVQITV